MKNLKGYTLIEILLSLALISMLAVISLPIFSNFQYKNELNTVVNLTVRALRTAQSFAQGSNGDSAWGVAFNGNAVTVFKGANYATRDVNSDYIYTFATNVGISGLSEVVYTKFLGIPQSSGTLTLSDTANSKQIIINAKGSLLY